MTFDDLNTVLLCPAHTGVKQLSESELTIASVRRPPPARLPPFAGPVLKVQRAANLFHELKRALLVEQIAVSPKELPELDLRGGMLMLGGHKPDQQIALILGDIIHNLRASLDLVVGDFVRITEHENDSASYPFVKKFEDFEKKVIKEFGRFGDEICKLFIDTKPYPGGNRFLRALHDLDIIDKHHVILPHFGVPMTRDPQNPYLWSGSDEHHFAIMVAFHGEPLDNEPLMPTIEVFFELTQSIIRDIATLAGHQDICAPVDLRRPL